MTNPDLVTRVADELAIRNIIALVAQRADLCTIDELDDYLALFAHDAEQNVGAGQPPAIGHDAIRAGGISRRESGMSGPGSKTRHIVTTTSVELHGDTATARSYFMFLGDTDSSPVLRMSGIYNDEFRRTTDGWKLQRRVSSFG